MDTTRAEKEGRGQVRLCGHAEQREWEGRTAVQEHLNVASLNQFGCDMERGGLEERAKVFDGRSASTSPLSLDGTGTGRMRGIGEGRRTPSPRTHTLPK